MSLVNKDSKPRATKNSQRLYNLEEQERLYKELGVTQMANNSVNPDLLEKVSEDERASEDSGEDTELNREVEPPALNGNKKKKRLSKESHIMSDSESDQEKDQGEKRDPDPEKKLKRKKKVRNQEPLVSPKQTRAKKAKLLSGVAFKKGKKSPTGSRVKGKKNSVNLSKPAIQLPQDLLTSPEDSSVIAAHMSAYTKWLLENKMLVSQQSLNQFSQPSPEDNMPPPPSFNANSTGGQGFPPQTIQNKNRNDSFPGNSAHDISTDESSNFDGSEFEGQPPFVQPGLPNSKQQTTKQNPVQIQPSQGNGELFKVCEAEKEVPLEEDNSVGPEVSEQMALMIKNFLGRNRKAAKIDDLLAEFIRPKNMPFLKPPFIEEEIYSDLAAGARHFDKNCRLLQGYIFAAVTALTMSLQSLILTEKLHPIITDAGVKVKKALQLLAFSTKEINDRRKDALKSSVNQDYLPLLKHAKPPSDDWLLGGELNDAIKKCDDSKKLSEKIMKNRKLQQNQNTQGQNQNYQTQTTNQEKFKYRYRGKKDAKPYYKNHNQYSTNQQAGQFSSSYHQQANPQFVQPVAQQQNQLQLWQQYQQQVQQAQAAQALQNQSLHRQNLGFHQNQQWREQQPQNQTYNANNYNQKKKN